MRRNGLSIAKFFLSFILVNKVESYFYPVVTGLIFSPKAGLLKEISVISLWLA